MNKQIDYTKVVHVRENSQANEDHLNANRYHFVGQCAVLLTLFQQGLRLTTRSAQLQFSIGDFRRRVKDLKDAGVELEWDWSYDKEGKKTRFKEWFINFKTDAEKKEHVYKKGEKTAADHAGELIKATKPKFIQPPLSDEFLK